MSHIVIRSHHSVNTEMKMNKNERRVAEKLRRDGWIVVRGGWPDFMCISPNPSGGKPLAKAVEVKTTTAKTVRPNQKRMHKALALAGIRTEIEVVNTSRTRYVGIKMTPQMAESVHVQACIRGIDDNDMVILMLTEWLEWQRGVPLEHCTEAPMSYFQ